MTETVNTDNTCAHCAWWADLGDGIGQCRRYAPRPRASTDQVVWPITEEYEYCGEFEDGEPMCGCDDDEMCAICGDDDTDDTDDQFDAIIAELTAPPARRRWWNRNTTKGDR